VLPTKNRNICLNQDGKRHHLCQCNSVRVHNRYRRSWRWERDRVAVRHQAQVVPPHPVQVHQVVAVARQAVAVARQAVAVVAHRLRQAREVLISQKCGQIC